MSKLDIMMLSFFNTLDDLEEQEKTAAEQMRYRPKVQAFLYQPDGRILASKDEQSHKKPIDMGQVMKALSIGKELAEQGIDASKAIKVQMLQNKVKSEQKDDIIDAINSARKALKK